MDYTLIEIIKKLTGHTSFFGETNHDELSVNNLRDMHDDIIQFIEDIVNWKGLENRSEGSAENIMIEKQRLANDIYLTVIPFVHIEKEDRDF